MDIIEKQCDRCKTKTTSEISCMGNAVGYPEGWFYSEDLGQDLCDDCGKDWGVILNAFKKSTKKQ